MGLTRYKDDPVFTAEWLDAENARLGTGTAIGRDILSWMEGWQKVDGRVKTWCLEEQAGSKSGG